VPETDSKMIVKIAPPLVAAALAAAGCGSAADGNGATTSARPGPSPPAKSQFRQPPPATGARHRRGGQPPRKHRQHQHRHPRRAAIRVSRCSYRTGRGCPRVAPPGSCHIQRRLQDRRCTPGALNPAVRQATIFSTICRPGGYTDSVRPPVSYTEPLKYREMAAYRFAGRSAGDFELDHLIPLELGGAPADPRNLWPEPHASGRGAYEKDVVENELHDQVCSGRISLARAQRQSLDWIAHYHGGSGPAGSGHGGGPGPAGLGGPGSTSPGDKDCADFPTQAQAQRFFRAHGGSPGYNYDGLDGDGDGKVCETLP
jgi:hypothetical protein